MTSPVPQNIADFVRERIDEIAELKGKTIDEIVEDADLKSAKFLSMVATGTAKLPLDRVRSLAKGLECDPAALMDYAIRQYVGGDELALVYAAANKRLHSDLTETKSWLAAIAASSLPLQEKMATLLELASEITDSIKDCRADCKNLFQEVDALSGTLSESV